MHKKFEELVFLSVIAVLTALYLVMLRLSVEQGNLLGIVVGSLGLVASVSLIFSAMADE